MRTYAALVMAAAAVAHPEFMAMDSKFHGMYCSRQFVLNETMMGMPLVQSANREVRLFRGDEDVTASRSFVPGETLAAYVQANEGACSSGEGAEFLIEVDGASFDPKHSGCGGARTPLDGNSVTMPQTGSVTFFVAWGCCKGLPPCQLLMSANLTLTAGAPTPAPGPASPTPQPTPAEAQFVCSVCQHVYDAKADGAGAAFDDLPDTWVCPVCGAPKSAYKPAMVGGRQVWKH